MLEYLVAAGTLQLHLIHLAYYVEHGTPQGYIYSCQTVCVKVPPDCVHPVQFRSVIQANNCISRLSIRVDADYLASAPHQNIGSELV